ncbi:unnamed protein product [Schistosoma curassoni]|uniref:SH3 domain-containing protein n=1 Tax=Schistosoma curassoni TaxID=6186 RepID=A0A183K6G6_9TREM|nr:unnamed protein product [Schistosoma curassoni]
MFFLSQDEIYWWEGGIIGPTPDIKSGQWDETVKVNTKVAEVKIINHNNNNSVTGSKKPSYRQYNLERMNEFTE